MGLLTPRGAAGGVGIWDRSSGGGGGGCGDGVPLNL